ncbi:glycosyltransferase family 2 protein [Acidianus sp. RZ1]|uniref:glycosyltransferase n=1 Tax=Acidianus sp. RZ1 TaxID=1540082 RepID=UPI0014913A69|nr:glycosyltransferase family 2 protein [Acidianus sp. RZ1]NON62454.1 glycosyltransferase family 2 protein [Acidianus sp. RZ1]
MEYLVLLALDIFSILFSLGIIYQIIRENKEFFGHKGSLSDFVSIIIPVRGLDPGFEENVKSLLGQNYDNYELIYVLDRDDPKAKELEDILSRYRITIVYSDYHCTSCSGKIRAQLSGLMKSKGKVVVFGDSDTFYPNYWLNRIVSPLDNYMATTTFSFASPISLSLKNLFRAGFWTLGFESQALNGTFLWGGSMAMKREFFDDYVTDQLSSEWCDDCTLTRIVKERKGKIGFIGEAIPLNIYNENSLIKWMQRQALTVKIYSYRGAKAFLVIGSLMSILLLGFVLTVNLVLLTPFVLWVIKNLLRGRSLGYKSLIPSLMSVPALFLAWFVLIYTWNKSEVIWRDKKYMLQSKGVK